MEKVIKINKTHIENDELPETTIKEQLQEIYSINSSMFSNDPKFIPQFTDGTPIRPQDLADMNMRSLEYISELLGFELE